MDANNLKAIARDCPEFDPIVTAQGYGISFLNGPMAVSCEDCVNWDDGCCELYIKASQVPPNHPR